VISLYEASVADVASSDIAAPVALHPALRATFSPLAGRRERVIPPLAGRRERVISPLAGRRMERSAPAGG
jgi:hypothetical protein